ncbi:MULTISPECIES: hypothetical protein [unclassified Pseudomonas]|uniref:hypothetical protein n=1 Tax=unclassified Pseudomonas TaxID=196821 RepID=UPI00380135BA
MLLALALFVSSALILPSRSEDEREGLCVYFEQDGRYALLFLSGYYLLGFIVNMLLFGVSPMALWGAFDVIMIMITLCVFAASSRKAYALLTVAFVPLNIADQVISLVT